MQKVVQVWQHISNKQEIRVLNIVNKIVAAEVLPTKQPIFLTTMDLETSYKMVGLQTLQENKPVANH
ncbi:MAG: hypothetical protein HY819_19980 [Acidobacteria bacterium]|nr:hypothetical protein [Acidobacteriota bacterium]